MNTEQAALTLWDLQAGESAEVTGFDQGLTTAYQGRIMEFGFQPGSQVECLLTPGFGAPRVYAVSNSVFSLDQEIAQAVFVESAGTSGGQT